MAGVTEAIAATLSLPQSDPEDDVLLLMASFVTAVEAGLRLGRSKEDLVNLLERMWDTT